MSGRLMGMVFNTTLPTAMKLILASYADHADEDGTSIYPGEARMVVKTSYSVPTVRRITAELLSTGLLIQTVRGKPGQQAKYELDLPLLSSVQIAHKPKGYHADTLYELADQAPKWVSATQEWVSGNSEQVSGIVGMGIVGDTPNVIEPPQPPENRHLAAKPRNVGWDFFTDPSGFNMPTGTATQRKRVGRLAKEVNATIVHFHTEGTERLNDDDLNAAALAWPKHFPDATLTPEAYAKHLPALLAAPLRGSRHAVKQATRAADDQALAARLAEVVP